MVSRLFKISTVLVFGLLGFLTLAASGAAAQTNTSCPSSLDYGSFGTGGGVAARDNATGTGYIMWSNENVYTRFTPQPINGAATKFIPVLHSGNSWYYDNNNVLTPFTPESDDCLVAEVDFSADTVTLLDNTSGVINGIDSTESELIITPNLWQGNNNAGEFALSLPPVNVESNCPAAFDLGDFGPGGAVTARDNATGTGYIMWSNEPVHDRFSPAPHPQAARQLVAIVSLNGTWHYDNNSSLIPLQVSDDDCLVAEVDFSADTVTSLQGFNGKINGIDAGWTSGDLVITPNLWFNNYNPGEFGITGTSLVHAQTPNQPDLTATSDINSISLSWSTASNGGSPILEWEYEYDLNPTFSNPIIVNNIDPNENSDIIEGLTDSDVRYVRARARNIVGWSDWSITQSASSIVFSNVPPTVTATSGHNEINLSWSEPNTNGVPILEYRYQYDTSVTFTNPLTIEGISATTFSTNISVTPQIDYFFRMSIRTAGGWSDWGAPDVAQAYTNPTEPVVVSALSELNAEIPIIWNAPNNSGGGTIVEYHVWLSTSSSMSNPTVVSTGTTLEHTFTGLNNGTTYYLQTFARNSHGLWSSGSQIVNATPATIASNLTANATTIDRGLNINWSANSNGYTISNVIIEYSQNPDLSGAATANVGSTITGSANVGGMIPWTNYYYRVRIDTNFGSIYSPIQLGGEIWTSTLFPFETLNPNTGLRSPNNAYYAVMQADGNFVIYGPGGVHNPGGVSGVRGNSPNTYAEVTPDGRFHIINVYISPVHGGNCPTGPINMVLQDDGNLVVRANTSPIWSWATDNLC